MNAKRFKKLKRNLRSLLEKHTLFAVVLLVILTSTFTAFAINSLDNDSRAENSQEINNVPESDSLDSESPKSNDVNATGINNSNDTSSSSSNQSSSTSGTSKKNDAYVPYSCVKTIVNYSTTYKTSYDGAGAVRSIGGNQGYTTKCTADSNGMKPSDANVPAVDRTIYVGTGGVSPTTQPIYTNESYEVVYARVHPVCDELSALTNADPVAMQWCKTNVFEVIMRYHNPSFVN